MHVSEPVQPIMFDFILYIMEIMGRRKQHNGAALLQNFATLTQKNNRWDISRPPNKSPSQWLYNMTQTKLNGAHSKSTELIHQNKVSHEFKQRPQT